MREVLNQLPQEVEAWKKVRPNIHGLVVNAKKGKRALAKRLLNPVTVADVRLGVKEHAGVLNLFQLIKLGVIEPFSPSQGALSTSERVWRDNRCGALFNFD